jgi:hypothetical protein
MSVTVTAGIAAKVKTLVLAITLGVAAVAEPGVIPVRAYEPPVTSVPAEVELPAAVRRATTGPDTAVNAVLPREASSHA